MCLKTIQFAFSKYFELYNFDDDTKVLFVLCSLKLATNLKEESQQIKYHLPTRYNSNPEIRELQIQR